MTTLNDFLQEHPVYPVRLYKPDPKDWFKDVMRYINRVSDWERRVEYLRQRAEMADAVADPDEDLTRYRDELHQKLGEAEQDMERVRVEVMDLIGELWYEDWRMIFIRRYLDRWSWRKIAWSLDQPVTDLHRYHAKALPVLKRILVEQGKIPDTYVCKGHADCVYSEKGAAYERTDSHE